MLRSLLLCSLTVAVLAAPASADVYRFKDEKGNVLYTDKPSTLPAERLDVQSQKTDVVAVQARQEAEQKRLQEGARARDQQRGQRDEEDEEQEAAQLSAKDKAERCAKARERYDSYMISQKLYEQLPNGERRYLTSQELDAARASAKAAMDAMCQ